jgi:hypothetical protein
MSSSSAYLPEARYQGDAGIQGILPCATALTFRSTRNQRCNCRPFLATVRSYRIIQLGVFLLLLIYPYAQASGRCRSPRHCAICASIPILLDPEAARQLHLNSCHRACVLHFTASCLCLLPIYRKVPSHVRFWDQDIMPSAKTLFLRSIRNQRCNCTPTLATVRLYCIFQLDVYVFCPFTRTSTRPGKCTPILVTVHLY